MASVEQSRETCPISPPNDRLREKCFKIPTVEAARLTVVALLALGAVTSHVAEATARIAGLLPTTESASKSAAVATTLRTAACNVSDLAALVALLTTGRAAVAISRANLGVFTGDVTTDAATVARLLLGGYGAFSAY